MESVPAPTSASPLTARALAAGCAIGALLTVANTYMALKTGIWDGGFPTGAILAFGIVGTLRRRSASPYSIQENLVTQAVAAAACAMPATAGLLGALPALALMGHDYPAWVIAGWGLALGVVGLTIALLLWRRLVREEALPFPSGRATAEAISAMHAAGRSGIDRARTLAGGGLVAAAVAWLRDGPQAWIAGVTALPLSIAGQSAHALTLGVSASPLMLGVGGLVGPQVGLSMLLGAILAWAVLAPAALHVGAVREVGFTPLVGWLTWPGVGLMVGGAMTALLLQGGMFLRSLRDLGAAGRAGAGSTDSETPAAFIARATAVGIAGVALALVVGWLGFRMHPLVTLLALALSVVLASVAARAGGQTDFVPLGPLGQLGQVLLGPATLGQPVANIAAASVVAGDPAQTTVLVYMQRAGDMLGVPLRRLWVCSLVGIAVGALVCVPAYVLITHAYGLGSEALPAPPARAWKAVTEVVTQGGAALPAHALQAGWIGLALGVVLSLIARGKLGAWLPSPVAMGTGFIIPAYYSITICLGAVLFALARRLRPEATDRLGPSLASGAIAGESLMGVAIAILISTGVLRVH